MGKKSHTESPGLQVITQLKDESRVTTPTQVFGQIGHSVDMPELA